MASGDFPLLSRNFQPEMSNQECTYTEIIGGVTPSIVIQLDELLVSKFLTGAKRRE